MIQSKVMNLKMIKIIKTWNRVKLVWKITKCQTNKLMYQYKAANPHISMSKINNLKINSLNQKDMKLLLRSENSLSKVLAKALLEA